VQYIDDGQSEFANQFSPTKSPKMTTSFLVFQLYGPMASWGEIAVGEERDTASHPSRTAVLGLCAAALGIKREQEEELLSLNGSLGFAVCVDEAGDIMRDYHTIQSPTGKRARDLPTRRDELSYGSLATTLSKRHYRTDAHYTVCLWRRGNDGPVVLTEIAAALEKPGFPLFLGRKSCPLALPLNPRVVAADSLRAAIATYPLPESIRQLARRSGEARSVYWDADTYGVEPGLETIHHTKRWDSLVSRKRWQFARRDEAFARMQRKPLEEVQ
jgi:CRISPR system Cascade subunit CasD